jgi:hypothetical protein
VRKKMNSLLGKSQRFLKKNSATILTFVGAAGVIATTVTAVKATPKAVLLLEKAKEEKGEELTKLESVKIAGPVYVPTVVLGVSTLACIFGANVLNKRGQAALMSAYALVDSGYKDYRKKVDELYGEEAGQQVRAGIAKDKYEEKYAENPIVPHEGKRLYYDFFSEQYFEATPYEVQKAEYELNRMLMLEDFVYLDDWYKMLGLEPFEPSNNFGWTTGCNMDAYWQTWIDFHHQKVELDEGLECIIISFMQDPFLNFEEWC